eukprot:scaffold166732_cov27-Tisochrysis_lutea.AAC.1
MEPTVKDLGQEPEPQIPTPTQVCIHATSNFNTPHIIELRGTVSLILQSAPHFLMVDTVSGMQVRSEMRRPSGCLVSDGTAHRLPC